MEALYICYWSLRDPLCQSQALPVVQALAAPTRVFGLVTFEQDPWKRTPAADRALRAELNRAHIHWMPLRYHKRPAGVATVVDIFQGMLLAIWVGTRHGVRVFHGRGSVAAAIAYLAAFLLRRRFFNDADGPLSQEYVDAGVWKKDSLWHRLTRHAESRFLATADTVAVLSEHRRREIESYCRRPPVVLPCGVDTSLFRADSSVRALLREQLGLSGTVFVYAGKIGGWYLVHEMLTFVQQSREVLGPVTLLVLSSDPAQRFPPPPGVVVVHRHATRHEMPGYLSAADVGLSFILSAPSKAACSPVKNGEYLAMGLPVVTTAGIGDYSLLLEQSHTGVVVQTLDAKGYGAATKRLRVLLADPTLRLRCRATAEEELSMSEVVVPRYRAIYQYLLEGTVSDIHN